MTNPRSLLAFALLLCAAACSGDSRATPGGGAAATATSADAVVAAWKSAGLTPAADLVATDSTKLGGGTCKVGVVDGVEVTLCEHPDEKSAAAAREAGLAAVGDVTGAALVSGRILLVVADRKKADPQGRTINKITKAFQGGK